MRRLRLLSLLALVAAAFVVAPAPCQARTTPRRPPASMSRRAVPVRIPAKRVQQPLPPKARPLPVPVSPMRTQVGRVWHDVSRHPEKLALAAMP